MSQTNDRVQKELDKEVNRFAEFCNRMLAEIARGLRLDVRSLVDAPTPIELDPDLCPRPDCRRPKSTSRKAAGKDLWICGNAHAWNPEEIREKNRQAKEAAERAEKATREETLYRNEPIFKTPFDVYESRHRDGERRLIYRDRRYSDYFVDPLKNKD